MTDDERTDRAREPADEHADTASSAAEDGASRRATLRTTHDDPAAVAGAVTPDNTDEMTTRVDGDRVVTTVERDSTGGLEATVDDYVVNLTVAARVVQTAKRTSDTESNHDQ